MSQRVNPFVSSSMTEQGPIPLDKHIQETESIQIDNTKTPQTIDTGSTSASSVDYTLKDCETLYGAAMETAHCLIGTRKEGIGHRELPEERRRLQGKMLHNICTKYNIQIPTEFEVIIFGGALIADWQYMTVKESEQETKTEPVQKAEPTKSTQGQLESTPEQPEATE